MLLVKRGKNDRAVRVARIVFFTFLSRIRQNYYVKWLRAHSIDPIP